MQFKLLVDYTRETSGVVFARIKSEVVKMSTFIPTSIQSTMAMVSVSKNASLELKEISSLALAQSAQTAKAQQCERLSRLMQGSARILATKNLPSANELVDEWIEAAQAQREELLKTG